MELTEAIETRRMVRRTDGRPLPMTRVRTVLDLARRAPSAGNAQGADLIVLHDRDRVATVATAAGEEAYLARGFDPWLSTAPVLVVPCADRRRYERRYAAPDKGGPGPDEWAVPYHWVDLGAVVQNLLLLAAAEGWAAGFLGEHAVEGLAALLGLPDGVAAAGIVTLGHPHPDGDRPTTSRRRPRRPLDDVLHLDHW